MTYQGVDGTKFTMFLDTGEAPRVNGRRITYAPPLMFNSPFVKSAWNSGKITIRRGSQSATYDFSVEQEGPAKVVH